jgi:hypothetical protein
MAYSENECVATLAEPSHEVRAADLL